MSLCFRAFVCSPGPLGSDFWGSFSLLAALSEGYIKIRDGSRGSGSRTQVLLLSPCVPHLSATLTELSRPFNGRIALFQPSLEGNASFLGKMPILGFEPAHFDFSPSLVPLGYFPLREGTDLMPLDLRGPTSPQGGDKASEAAVTVLPLPRLDSGDRRLPDTLPSVMRQ